MPETIIKYWGKGRCNKSDDGLHWAYYTPENEIEEKYWREDHKDDENKAYWRHHDFMSIPCYLCGEYSPLRSATSFMRGIVFTETCQRKDVIDYHPDEKLPDSLAYYRENGWSYIYFKETLSDSMIGQETFRLAALPQ